MKTIEQRIQHTSSHSVVDSSHMTVNIITEFLNRCQFNCPGCFVNRRNGYSDDDLDVVLHFAKQFDPDIYEMNEILLGPTDIFGSENTIDLLNNPKFIELFTIFQAISNPTTLQSTPEEVHKIHTLFKTRFPPEMHLELFVALDINQFEQNSIQYLDRLDQNLEVVKGSNIIFVFNAQSTGSFGSKSYSELSAEINSRYDAHLRMNPSFFRSQKPSIIKREMSAWTTEAERCVADGNSQRILFNTADAYFGGHTYRTYVYKDGDMYISPCVYDFIYDKNELLKLQSDDDGLFHLDTVSKKEQQLIIDQYEYANTIECGTCPHLHSCVSRKVLSFMEDKQLVDCVMCRGILDTARGFNRIDDNAIAGLPKR